MFQVEFRAATKLLWLSEFVLLPLLETEEPTPVVDMTLNLVMFQVQML